MANNASTLNSLSPPLAVCKTNTRVIFVAFCIQQMPMFSIEQGLVEISDILPSSSSSGPFLFLSTCGSISLLQNKVKRQKKNSFPFKGLYGTEGILSTKIYLYNSFRSKHSTSIAVTCLTQNKPEDQVLQWFKHGFQ